MSKSDKDLQQAGMSKKIKIPGKDMFLQDYNKESSKFEDDNIEEKSINAAQGSLSIWQRNYTKLIPIVKELYRC